MPLVKAQENGTCNGRIHTILMIDVCGTEMVEGGFTSIFQCQIMYQICTVFLELEPLLSPLPGLSRMEI